jgi:predicted RNase H-like HicB family nuclease
LGILAVWLARVSSYLSSSQVSVSVVHPGSWFERSSGGDSCNYLETNRWNLEATMSSYPIILERADDGSWSAMAPNLPGLVLAADSRDELLAGAPAAIADYIETLRDEQLPIPEPGEVELIRVAV